ncbi:Protein of unknown function DUF247 [Macleaya cordata]|uniref:Uncharacterized protein n=1 Tax=Macleaya cordata TaxID=56857 RepID=A0A200QQB3_MACCD|nr:Protein of unknown function DUF247 [Macleaya cordata]
MVVSYMLEILRAWDPDHSSSASHLDYSEDDPIFSRRGKFYMMKPVWKDACLLLENQLPLLLLEELVKYYIRWLLVKFLLLKQPIYIDNYGECLHILDMYMRSLVKEKDHSTRRPQPSQPIAQQRWNTHTEVLWSTEKAEDSHNRHPQSQTPHRVFDVADRSIPLKSFSWCVRKLQAAGISFKASKTCAIKDISFHNGVLSLPPVAIDRLTKPLFLNLMAYERCHLGAGKQVTNYVSLFMSLITTSKDLRILADKRILFQFLDDHESLEVCRL